LDRAELDRVIDVCAEIRDEVGMADWRSTRRKAAAAGSGVKPPWLARQRGRPPAIRL
jgi:CAI-1 autoinducer synthase